MNRDNNGGVELEFPTSLIEISFFPAGEITHTPLLPTSHKVDRGQTALSMRCGQANCEFVTFVMWQAKREGRMTAEMIQESRQTLIDETKPAFCEG